MKKLILNLILSFMMISAGYSQNLINGPDDMVFDLKYNRILVGNWAGNNIIAVDSNGNQTVFKTGLQYCHGMELFADTLYAASANKIYLININNAQTVRTITVAGSARLGHLTIDTVNYLLYVSDWNVEKIFKVSLTENTSSLLMNSGNGTPLGILFDGINNRLILMTFGTNIPVKAVNIQNGQVTNITGGIYNNLDAITCDENGFIYFTSFSDGIVYKTDSSFSGPVLTFSSNHNGPSGLGYDKNHHILGVTNYNSNSITQISIPVDIRKISELMPEGYILYQNYPNPFNPSTKICFSIPKQEFVVLGIFNILGETVAELINEKLQAGNYSYDFNASELSSGVYFYRINAGKFTNVKRMIYLK